MKKVFGWIFGVATVVFTAIFVVAVLLLGNQGITSWLNKESVLFIVWTFFGVWAITGFTSLILLFLPAKTTKVNKGNVKKQHPALLSKRTKQSAE